MLLIERLGTAISIEGRPISIEGGQIGTSPTRTIVVPGCACILVQKHVTYRIYLALQREAGDREV